MTEHLSNNATTTLVDAIGVSDTVLHVASTAIFPAPNFRILIDNEIMLVTAKTTDHFTVTRAVEGSRATSHNRTTPIYQTLTVQGLLNTIQENTGFSSANTINVSPTSAITSIAAAANSITDSSDTNRYIIRVAPGRYTEPVINLPSFVFVVGDHIDAVVVEPDDDDHHVFVLANRTGLQGLTIEGAGPGYAGVYSNNVGDWALLHKVTITECDIGLLHECHTLDSFLYLEYVDFSSCTTNAIKVNGDTAYYSYLNAENLFVQNYVTNPTNTIVCSGNSRVSIEGGSFIGVFPVVSGNAILVTNGASLFVSACKISLFYRGIYVDTTGHDPYLTVTGTDFDTCTYNVDIPNTTAHGDFTGYSEYTKTIINKSNTFFITNSDERTITVAKKGGNFSSIKDAVDSIADNNYDNRYTVSIGPGIYVEDTITMKDYVSICGEETRSTIVELKTSPSTSNLIVCPNNVNVTIRKLLLRNDISGGNTIRYLGGVTHFDQLRFGTLSATSNNGVAINAGGVNGATENSLTITNCSTAKVCAIPLLMKFSDDGTHDFHTIITDLTTGDTLAGFKNIAEIGIVSGGDRGTHTEVCFVGMDTTGDGTGTAIKIADGADLHLLSGIITDFDIGIHAPNQGSGPEIEIMGSLIYDSTTYDLLIEHLSATGILSLTCDQDKVSINDSSTIAILTQDADDGTLNLTGDFFQGSKYSTTTNMTPSMTQTPPAGVISGGGLSKVAGLIISVASGTGYVYGVDPATSVIKYVTWNTGQLTLVTNAINFIYVDEDGHLNKSTTTPSFFDTIVVGRAITTAAGVLILGPNPRIATAISSRFDKFFRYYIGPVYRSGSNVTANNLALNVTGGNYGYAELEYEPLGGTPITFSTWYRNGAWYTITESVTDIPNTYYDGGAGLVEMTGGLWAKHLLLIYGGQGGDPEQYFLVYGQEEFPSSAAAETGALPSIPEPLTLSICSIASVIVQKSAAAIFEVLDERPTLITKTGTGTTASSDHLALSNLNAGNAGHSQFMLLTGTTPMADDLDLGTNNVINVGTVDGVDVSAHIARHVPGGLDPLTTAAPNANLSASSTNTDGVQTTLSRSDHTHAITTATANTVSTIVARDASGNFSAGMITANLTGNVTGNTSGTAASFTGSLVGDVTGSQAATVVATVGGSSAANVHTAELLANAATNLNTVSTIVKRDGSGNFVAGTITANLSGNVTGNVTGNTSGTAGSFTGSLVGDVTGTQGATVVATVGTSSAANVHAAELLANAATNANTANAIIKRDASGNFNAGTITANLTGSVTGGCSGSAASFTGSLVGDVTGTQGATVVSTVGTSSAANVHTAELLANAATNANTANAIVKRDASGDFNAGTITANLTGDVTGTASNVSGVVAIANGGTNSSTALNNNRVIISSGSAIVETGAITASRALASNASGLPVASATTAAELAFVNGVTSAIQTQFSNKASTGDLSAHTGSTSNPHTTTLEQARTANSQLSGNIDANNNTITGLPDPSDPGDACNKSYADAIASGLNVKDPCRVATTADLSATYSAVTKKLTSVANEALVIDVVTLAATNRVLVKNQGTQTENGIYIVSDIGLADPGGHQWILTRASDFDTTAEITNGSFTLVTAGTVNIGSGYVLTSTPPITLDVTNLVWSKFSQSTTVTPGAGLEWNATAFDVQVDDSTIAISGGNELIVKGSGIGDTQLDKANISLSGFGVPTGDISMATNSITNLKSPGNNNDAARKIDVDTVQGNLTSHIGTGGGSHAQVTAAVDGFMIAADKVKLDAATNANTASAIVRRDGSGDFTAGTITAALSGNVTGSVTGNVSGSAASFTGSLIGDVTGTQGATVVATVGTSTAALVHAAELLANAATNANTASTIVKRDASGNFTAGTITAALTGNCSGSAASFTGSLVGDVTGTQGATVVSTVGTSSAANVHAAELLSNAATNLNTASTIVKRDGSGNFTAGTITANLTGSVTGNCSGTSASFTGSLVGDVTGTQGATVVSTVGTSSAANVHAAELLANAATNANTASAIVKRDASGNFTAGIITAALSGNVTGNLTGSVTGNCSGSAASFTGSLVGDVTGTQGATVVATVGTSTAALIHAAELLANAATNLNTASAIVKRDGSGNFTAGTITANLTGSVTGNASGLSSVLPIATGGTNSSTALSNGRLMVSSGGKIVEAPAIQTSTTATTSMTTTAGQVVIVQVKANVAITTGGDVTITLAYGGVTKDTLVINGANGDSHPLFLQYTETPGAATANLVLATTNGTFANIRYIITKIG